jgi:hypothetical protein
MVGDPVGIGREHPLFRFVEIGPPLRFFTPSVGPPVQDKELQYYINFIVGHPFYGNSKNR